MPNLTTNSKALSKINVDGAKKKRLFSPVALFVVAAFSLLTIAAYAPKANASAATLVMSTPAGSGAFELHACKTYRATGYGPLYEITVVGVKPSNSGAASWSVRTPTSGTTTVSQWIGGSVSSATTWSQVGVVVNFTQTYGFGAFGTSLYTVQIADC